MRAAKTPSRSRPKSPTDLLELAEVWTLGQSIAQQRREEEVSKARIHTYTTIATGAVLALALTQAWYLLLTAAGLTLACASVSVFKEVSARRRYISPFEAITQGVKAAGFDRIKACAIVPKKGYRLRLNPHLFVADEATARYALTQREWTLVDALTTEGFTGSVEDVINVVRELA